MTTNADLIAQARAGGAWDKDFSSYSEDAQPFKLLRDLADALAAADRREMEAAAREAGLREALHPIVGWIDHVDATSSRRLLDSEWPPPAGEPPIGELRACRKALAHPPSAASLRYQRLVDVVEAARSFVTALYSPGWPSHKCRVLREALSALDQPTQEPG
jgi:hypothetical protein